jgi:AcrR family transcriptional regulator
MKQRVQADKTLEREPRGARRKRETRARLLEAALRLMAEKGVEGVAISEITEAADVGFGSFYNHFESKQAIYEAVVDSVFEDYADWLDRVLADRTDPAEIVAISIRYGLTRALEDPLWGQFLVREGLSMRSLNRGLGRRLMRDIQKGIDAGRFAADDPSMKFISVGGTVLLSIAAASTNVENKLTTKDLPERAASAALRILGLDRKEADRIARRPLPA